MGFASVVSASRTDPVSNTRFAVCRVAICTSTVRGLLRDATHKSPSPLTSLQRVEATDALPILKRPVMSRVRRGPATCLRFCTVRERCVCVRHGEVRQPMCALRRFAPAMRMRRVFPPTRTHLPFASSSVAVFLLRDRPARRYQMGAFCRSLISAPSKLGG